ncbi:MAG: hypothetical protein WDO73_03505 [Ignavibacteriota bacterium]
MLRDLDAIPDVLVVLNHPLSNELRCDFRTHVRLLQRFLRDYGSYFHALELNGLQPLRHNQRVAEMAEELGYARDLRRRPSLHGAERQRQPDERRHVRGVRGRDSAGAGQPRAVHAASTASRYPARYVEFISQAVATYPEFAGRERWIDRVFKDSENGPEAVGRSLAGMEVPGRFACSSRPSG